MIRPAAAPIEIAPELLDSIRSFDATREVEHCGDRFSVPAFDFYASCPKCGSRLKVRGFSANGELADVFDAVFEWINHPDHAALSARRQMELKDD